MTTEDRSKLHKEICDIVDDHSGGIKFLDLLMILLDLDRTRIQITCFTDQIEDICRSSNDIKILDYSSRKHSRSKMFIYTP